MSQCGPFSPNQDGGECTLLVNHFFILCEINFSGLVPHFKSHYTRGWVLVRYLFREASWTCGTWKPWKAWAGQEELVECCRGGMRSCKQVKRCGFARRLLPFTEWHGFGAVVLCWMLWPASRHWKTEGYIFMTSYCCFHVSLVCSITAMGFPCLWSG